MKAYLADEFVDPAYGHPLKLEVVEACGDDILNGRLLAEDGTVYPIRHGIPRFVLTSDESQIQTSSAFGYKWKKRDAYDSQVFADLMVPWMLEMYGFNSLDSWAECLASGQRILDVGCGSGFTAGLWLNTSKWDGGVMYVGIDISEAIDVAQERIGRFNNTHFAQADALQLPFPDGSFDTVISDGVLHHTASTRDAMLSAARVLKSGGRFHFYVYRRKGPVREFTDDYIRGQIASLSDEDAWDAMRSLTYLGKILSDADVKIKLEEDIPLFGIKAGQHDVQRLIYWNFAKLYWNPVLSFEENVHVNFDWYRPLYAHRQTAEEIRRWCGEAQLQIKWFHDQESGFTVKAVKE